MSIRKKRNILSLIGLIIILVLGPLAYFRFIKPRLTSAAWFDDKFYYRKAVNITNSSGSALTDFQVSISIGTSANIAAGKMKSDCSDIRITDTNGKLLPHWIEKNSNNSCNKTSTLIWVKVPSIPTSGGTAYIYYGNPSATNTENGKSVFPDYFEDFSGFSNGTDITNVSSNWSKDVDYLSTFTIDSNRLKMIHSGTAPNEARDGAIYTFPNEITTNFAVDADVTVADSNSYDFMMIVADSGWAGMASSHTYSALWSAINNENWQGWSSSDSTWLSAQSGLTVGNIYQFGITFNISGDLAKMYVDDIYKIDRAFPDTGTTGLKKIAFGNYGYSSIDSTWYVDNIRVRKHASTPPTTSLSSTEEQSKAPVAYWSFDEGQGTIAYDATSNKNNGTLGASTAAPTWQTEDMCVSGKCLKFDGSNDYVNVGDKNVLDFSGSFSLAMWVKTKQSLTSNNYAALAGKGFLQNSTGFGGYGIVLNGDDSSNVYFQVRQSDNAAKQVSGGSINDGLWHYVEGVRDNSNNISYIYIDGFLKNTVNGSNSIYSSDRYFTIGAVESSGAGAYGRYFNGFIDDVKIYPYARSAAEVKADYNAGKSHAGTAKGSSVNLGSNQKSSEAFSEGLVGYWKMEENTGTTVADSSGNSNTATLGTGDSAPGWVSGMYGVGLSFAGTQQYVEGNISNLPTTGNGTFSFWAKNNGTTSGAAISFQKADGNDNYLIIYPYSSGAIVLSAAWKSWVVDNTGVSSLPNGQWGHYVFVADTSTLYLYLNGSRIWSSPRTTSPGAPVKFRFGNRYWSNAPFAGTIDEVRYYNRALSPAEVQQLYNWAPGPVGYWNFDEGVGSSAYDSSGNSLSGLIQSGLNWTTGKYGKALSFPGTTSKVVITDNILLKPPTISVGFWFKPASTVPAYQNLINKGWNDAGTWAIYLANATLTFAISNSSGTPYYGSAANVSTNTWSYFAGTFDGTNVCGYLNGIKKSCQTVSGTGFLIYPATLTFNTTSSTYTGLIDEVKIYNYARTAKQIVEDMNAGLALRSGSVGGASAGGVVAKYSFDEGYGTTVHNDGFGGSSLNGTLGASTAAPTWSNDGKFGKTLSFDGNDYISTGIGLSNSDKTMTFWAKPSSDMSSGSGLVAGNVAVTNNRFYLGYSSGKFYIGSGNSGDSTSVNLLDTSTNWHHFALVDLGTTAIVYEDGKRAGSISWTGTNDGTINIGRAGGTNNVYFNGHIDEVKIYNYALTQDEIKIDYNQGQALVLGSLSSGTGNTAPATASSQEYCIPGDTATCSPPVARWDFNEGVGTSAYDTSGNGNNGGWNGTGTHWSAGKYGKAGKFNGSDDFTITAISTLLNTPGSQISGGAWIYPNALANSWARIFFMGSDTPYSFGFGSSASSQSDKLRLVIGGAGGITCQDTTNSLPLNKWSYAAYTYNSGTAIIYLNGQPIFTCTGGPTNLNANASATFRIGGYAGGYFFNGKIDQARVFNYARSPAQIAWDYNRGGPVAWWDFDECQGGTAHNRQPSTSNLDGTITIGPLGTQAVLGTCAIGTGSTAAWGNGSSGKYNASLNFDGTDDYVSVGTGSSVNSVSFWTKPTTNTASMIQLATGIGVTASSGVITAPGFTSPSIYVNGIPGRTLTAGSWQMVTVTSATAVNPSAVRFGLFGSTYYSGQMDEVKIWNYPLTSVQVKNEYNQGAAIRFGPSEGNP